MESTKLRAFRRLYRHEEYGQDGLGAEATTKEQRPEDSPPGLGFQNVRSQNSAVFEKGRACIQRKGVLYSRTRNGRPMSEFRLSPQNRDDASREEVNPVLTGLRGGKQLLNHSMHIKFAVLYNKVEHASFSFGTATYTVTHKHNKHSTPTL